MDRLRTKTIPPEGPFSAELCYIGEAPGAEEDRQVRPFVGSAGQLLDRCNRSAGILRKDILVTNIFSQRPPNNKVDYFYKDSKRTILTWEGEEHLEELRRWLEELKGREKHPNLLVALGETAMYHLTGKKGITKHRGSVYPCTLVEGFKVYCSFHPSYVNRLINEPMERLQGEKKKQQQNAHALFSIDLDRIKEEGKSPTLVYPEREFKTNLPFSELLSHIENLNMAAQVAVDIETLPGESGPVVWCIGFAWQPGTAFTVPIIKQQAFRWRIDDEAKIWRAISKLFLNPKVIKIFQGGAYDLSILGRYYGLRCAPNTYHDTMLLHHAPYPYIPKGLHILASIYTNEPYYKDEGRVSWGKRTDDGEFKYNSKDCCVTREIYPVVARHAREGGFWEGYLRTIGVMPSLLGMMIRGVRIDTEKKKVLGKEFTNLALKNQELVNEEAGGEYNISSSSQIQQLLYGHLRLPIQINRKTGKATVDHDALISLQKKHPNLSILNHIIQARKYAKLSSTYTSMDIDADGRVRTSYGFISTWRLSSSESHFGSGGNLQNIPKRSEEGNMIRSLFIPDEGKILLSADLSQAEARVVAWEAGDIRQIDLFLKGEDVHWENTKMLFGLPLDLEYQPKIPYQDPITNGEYLMEKLRDIGKTCRHAGNYGMGWMKLQAILAASGFHFPVQTCKRLVDRDKANNPMTQLWQEAIREQIRSRRTLISSFGRKREFMGRFGDALYRSAYAFSPQNTVGELLEVATQKIWKEIPEVEILLSVHDEVVVQVEPKDMGKVIPRMRECMEIELTIAERAIPTNERKLTIPVDFKVGKNWGEMKEVE